MTCGALAADSVSVAPVGGGARRCSAGRVRWRCAATLVLAAFPLAAAAQPRLRSADVHVTFDSATTCAVSMTLGTDTLPEIEHRLDVTGEARAVVEAIEGATIAGSPAPLGRTLALRLTNAAARYVVRYQVSGARPFRCPLWLPTMPTAGREPVVAIRVRVPAGATPRRTMPALSWADGEGTTTLAHLPASVHVPFAVAGEPAPWDIARLMDLAAVGTLFAATLVWAVRQRRRAEPPAAT